MCPAHFLLFHFHSLDGFESSELKSPSETLNRAVFGIFSISQINNPRSVNPQYILHRKYLESRSKNRSGIVFHSVSKDCPSNECIEKKYCFPILQNRILNIFKISGPAGPLISESHDRQPFSLTFHF